MQEILFVECKYPKLQQNLLISRFYVIFFNKWSKDLFFIPLWDYTCYSFPLYCIFQQLEQKLFVFIKVLYLGWAEIWDQLWFHIFLVKLLKLMYCFWHVMLLFFYWFWYFRSWLWYCITETFRLCKIYYISRLFYQYSWFSYLSLLLLRSFHSITNKKWL